MSSTLPLPDAWIDSLFRKMHGLYGSLWLDRWRIGEEAMDGSDAGMNNAKAIWAAALGIYRDNPKRISKAIEFCNTKPFPPTLPEFLELCRQAPDEIAQVALPAPIDTAAAALRLEAAVEAVSKPERDHLRWAKRTDLSEQAKKNIMDLVEGVDCPSGRDPRFKPIFMEHYKAGRIKGGRANSLAKSH